MRIFANLNERTVNRKFTEPRHRRRPLIVLDHTLPPFGLKIAANESKTFFVRVKRGLNAVNLALGTAKELIAAQARDRAIAAIEAAKVERETGTLFRDFGGEFLRRQSRRWKPATRSLTVANFLVKSKSDIGAVGIQPSAPFYLTELGRGGWETRDEMENRRARRCRTIGQLV